MGYRGCVLGDVSVYVACVRPQSRAMGYRGAPPARDESGHSPEFGAMSASLAGQVAIVTGAGRMRGIGRAIALRLAEDGADVVVAALARPQDTMPAHERDAHWHGAKSVADEIAAIGRRGLALDVDVTKRDAVEEM